MLERYLNGFDSGTINSGAAGKAAHDEGMVNTPGRIIAKDKGKCSIVIDLDKQIIDCSTRVSHQTIHAYALMKHTKLKTKATTVCAEFSTKAALSMCVLPLPFCGVFSSLSRVTHTHTHTHRERCWYHMCDNI